MGPFRIHVLALQDCTALVPVGFMDMLRKSLVIAAASPATRSRRFEVSLVAASKNVKVSCAGGLRVDCDATLSDIKRSNLVLVPALDPDVIAHLAQNRQAVPWLQRIYLAGADIASACTGSFLLAEAGLLDRKAATTHWAFQDLFKQRYPLVRLEPQAIVVDQGRIVTAGGATSFLSLALYIVERLLGPEVARAASKMFLVDVNKSPQSAYSMFASQKDHGDEEILLAQDIIEKEVRLATTVEALAHRSGMSKRNFVRRFKSATGNVPREYLQRVRVEAAKRLLETGQRSIGAIAKQVGYEDVVAFRRLFTRSSGLSPGEYRKRYGSRSAPAFVGRKRAV